jgi:hypothetical protein
MKLTNFSIQLILVCNLEKCCKLTLVIVIFSFPNLEQYVIHKYLQLLSCILHIYLVNLILQILSSHL